MWYQGKSCYSRHYRTPKVLICHYPEMCCLMVWLKFCSHCVSILVYFLAKCTFHAIFNYQIYVQNFWFERRWEVVAWMRRWRLYVTRGRSVLFALTERVTEVMSDLIDCAVVSLSMRSDTSFPLVLGGGLVNAYRCDGVQWKTV